MRDLIIGVDGGGTKTNLVAVDAATGSIVAASKGIITMSENHGFIMQNADRLLELYTAVGCTNYRYLCDIGNFICADEDSTIAVGKLKDLIAHAHVKDFIRSGMEPAPGKGWFQTRSGNYVRGTIFG